ncbi:MAG: cyclase family protein [Leptospira sp.]|nr:cyclase family protein [Leptospira sp.]
MTSMFLSHILDPGTPLYGGKDHISLERVKKISDGDSTNHTFLKFPGHSGTHIDAPLHFDESGKALEEYDSSFWICRNIFLIDSEVTAGSLIRLENFQRKLESIPVNTDLLLIRTGFEKKRNHENEYDREDYIFRNPGISPEIGLWLRKNRKMKMIGFDFISLSSYQHRETGRIAHKAFLAKTGIGSPLKNEELGEPILIIEDMKLSVLEKIPNRVTVSPLLYERSDGAPVTVIAEFS